MQTRSLPVEFSSRAAFTLFRFPITLLSLVGIVLAAGLGGRVWADGADFFADRALLVGSEASGRGDFAGASWEAGEPDAPFPTAGRSLWWTWVAPAAGEVQVDVLGFRSDFSEELDTVLGVFTGDSLGSLSVVDWNDDGALGLSSRVRFPAEGGATYHFLADLHGFEPATGMAFLNLTFEASSGERPDNDRFADATVLTGTEASDESSFQFATPEVGEPELPYPTRDRTLWWRWTPSGEGLGVVEVGGVASTLDTVLGVYTGTTLDTLETLAVNDDAGSSSGSGSLAAFMVSPGTTYSIQVDLYDSGDSGTGPVQISVKVLNLPPLELRPANDAFANAALLSGLSGRGEADTQYATGEPGEPEDHGGVRSQSVWWKWTAPKGGLLRVNTLGSTTPSGAPVDTYLAAYRGASLGTLSELASNDDVGSLLTSQVEMFVGAGDVVYLAVAPVVGSPAGTVRLGYELVDGPVAPEWTARGLDGSVVESSAFEGSVQLVNLWATWCGPCRDEIPDLISLHEQYQSQGFVVLGVSLDSPVDGDWPTRLVADFVDEYQITYPVVLDQPSGTVEAGFGDISSIPTTFLVDRQGRIVRRVVGSRSRSFFEQMILPYLAAPPEMPALAAGLLPDGRLELSWVTQADLQLQAGPTLTGPWNGIVANPVTQGDRQVVTLAPEPGQVFYRLNRP